MKNIFHKPSSKEILRKQKRALNRAIRDLDRERIKLEQQEKQLIVNIKNTAKKNQVVRINKNIFNIFFFF